MRVVINEAQIKRNRQISHIMFFISLAGMGVGFYYTWTSDPSSSANQISCFILPILMLLTLTSVRMANNWIREPRPKDVLAESLKGLGKKYTIFHYLLPAPHVLIGPEGVFAITTVWQEGHFHIEGKRWRGNEGFGRRLLGFLRQDLVGNPFTDAVFYTQQLQKVVDRVAPDRGIEVQPLVVLINPNAEFEAEEPLFPLLYADTKQKPNLRDYLKERSAQAHKSLTEEELDKIDEMYGLMTRHEIAEMLGQVDSADEEDSAAEPDTAAPAPADDTEPAESEAGTVFVAQAGQLFYIGVTDSTPEAEIEERDLQAEVKDDIEILLSFSTDTPQKTVKRLRDKFDRKRQKEHWYGLSKKDIAWLKEQQG